MTGRWRSITKVVVVVLLVASCGAPVPTSTPPQSPEPPTPSAPPSHESTPTFTPTPSPAPATARLEVTGSGSCQAINYGGCWPVLLLEQAPARELFDWVPAEGDFEFENNVDDYPNIAATGPPENVPQALGPGHWAVGLGIGESSDVGGTPNWGTVICVRGFEVTEETQLVAITAQFDQPCSIEISIVPAQPAAETVQPVPPWSPPVGGIMDDCGYRRVVLRLDLDARPWYEEVTTGARIEIADPRFAGFSVRRRGDEAVLIDPEGIEDVPEWYVDLINCVIEAGDLTWFGGEDTAWQPWERTLGIEAVYTAKQLLEIGRGHMGGPPPAAATLTAPLINDLDEAALLRLDDEIGRSGAAWWSATLPGVFIGNQNAIAVAIGTTGSVGDDFNWQWIEMPGGGGRSGGADGWGAQWVRKFETPARNTVWAVGERLTLWDDCSKAVLPPIRTGGTDVLESGIDVDGGIVDARIFGEGDSHTQVVADFRDDRCRSHAVIGPIIDHLLADLEPPASPLATAPPRFDAIGRLAEAPVAGRCPILVDDEGTTWEIALPSEYSLSNDGTLKVFDYRGQVIAAEGDLLAIEGEPDLNGLSVCTVGRPLNVTRIVFVESARPDPTPSATPSPVAQPCSGTMLPSLLDEHEDSVVSILDRAAGLLTITVSSDYDSFDRISVAYEDPVCLAHPLVGPIITGAIDGFGSMQSDYEDRVGRLIVTNAEAGCSVILLEEGWTFNLVWPERFEVRETGVFGAEGEMVAEVGDVVRVKGSERREVLGACVEEWTLTVQDVTLVEPLSAT